MSRGITFTLAVVLAASPVLTPCAFAVGPTLREQEEKARAAYDRINAMVRGGNLTAAFTATEAAIKDYADCPEGLHRLRGAKVYLLVRLPDKQKEAAKFAAGWVADTKRERNPLHESRCRGLAAFLLNAADTPEVKDRDRRLIDLAIELLHDTDKNLHLYIQGQGRMESHVLSYRVHIHQLLARGFFLRGEPTTAVRQIEAAIALHRKRQPPEGEDKIEFRKEHARVLATLNDELAKYKQAAESQPKKP